MAREEERCPQLAGVVLGLAEVSPGRGTEMGFVGPGLGPAGLTRLLARRSSSKRGDVLGRLTGRLRSETGDVLGRLTGRPGSGTGDGGGTETVAAGDC